MLVLSRLVGERILIGDDIAIMITRMHGQTAHIGIEAPRHINIRREEVELASQNTATLQETTP